MSGGRRIWQQEADLGFPPMPGADFGEVDAPPPGAMVDPLITHNTARPPCRPRALSPSAGRIRASRRADVLVMLLCGIIAIVATLTNLGVTRQFIGYDAGIGMAVPATAPRQLSSWGDLYAPGVPTAASSLAVLWVGFDYVLSLLSIAPKVAERAYYGVLILSALASGYWLVRTFLVYIFKQPPDWRTSMVAAATAGWYAFCPYALLLITYPVTPHEITWALLPLVLTFLLRGVFFGQSLRHAVLLAGCAAILASGNPALSFVSIALGIMVIVICKVSLGELPTGSSRFLMAAVGFTVLFTAYIWVPVVASGSNPYAAAGRVNGFANVTTDAEAYNSIRTSLQNLLRTDGSIAFPEQTYAHYVNGGSLWLASAYATAVLALGAIPIVKTNRRAVMVTVVGLVVFLFLAKGQHAPIGQPLTWLYSHFYPFAAFRNSHDKFMIGFLVAECMLFAVALRTLLGRSGRWLTAPAAVLICLLPVPYVALGVGGQIANQRYLSSVPPEYSQLRTLMASADDSGTAFAGPDFYGVSYLTWYQGNVPPDPLLLGVPTVTEQFLRSSGFNLSTSDMTRYRTEINRAFDLLPFLGVRYLVIHKDVLPSIATGSRQNPVNVDTMSQVEAVEMVTALSARSDVRQIAGNRYFNAYVYCDARVRPDVYSSADIRAPGASFDSVPSGVSTGCRAEATRPTWLSMANGSAATGAQFQQSEPVTPNVSVRESSAGYRLVRVTNATAPVFLILSQSFDPDWTAYVARGDSPPILGNLPFPRGGSVPNHYRANFFLNAWVLQDTGSYWVILIYRPQGYFAVGEWTSTVAVLGSMCWIAAAEIRSFRRRRARPSV